MKCLFGFKTVLIICIFLVNGCHFETDGKKPPIAEKGVLDLRGWDFGNDGAMTLEGDWEIYWSEFVRPSDFLRGPTPERTGYIGIHRTWNGFLVDGRPIDGIGYATFRLKLLLPDASEALAIDMPNVGTAYTLFLNGKPVSSNGTIGKTSETSVPQYLPYIVDLAPGLREVELVLHISNFHHEKGGIRRSIRVGPESVFRRETAYNRTLNLLVLGCLLVIGFYHLGIFMMRNQEKPSLYFAGFCFLMSLRILITVEFSLTHAITALSWFVQLRIEYLTVYLAVPVFVMYLHSLFPHEFTRGSRLVINGVGLVFTLTALFAPPLFLTSTLKAYQVFLFFCFCYAVYLMTMAAIRKREGIQVLLVGFSIMLASAINDLLNINQIIETGLFLQQGFFVFTVFQALLLVRRVSSSFTRVENLTVELERTNDKLIGLDRLKDEFLANTSHELRTPLAGIIGLSESLHQRIGGSISSQDRQDLELINQSGLRLTGLINDILDFSQLKHGGLTLHIKPLRLKEIAESVLRHCRPLTAQKKLNLVASIPTDLPAVAADDLRLQQILFNLIGNAVKFTPEGKIEVSAQLEGAKITVRIRDTGIGIARENLPSIFNLFEQGEELFDGRGEGTGLGLALTKKLVELHQGEMDVDSELGKGSCFSFTLPVHPDEPEKVPPAMLQRIDALDPEVHFQQLPDAEVERETGGNDSDPMPHILVVDDDAVILKVLGNYLSGQSYRISMATGGFEAVELVESEPSIDLVLLDIMMPDMDGYEVCRRLRQRFSPSELPILLLTARSRPQDMVAGLETGANDYLVKPVNRQELLARVRNQLEIGRSVQRLKENLRLHEEIEKRKRLEKELAFSRRRLMRILDMTEEAIVSVNGEKKVTFLNQNAERVFDCRGMDIVGQAVTDLIPNLPEDLFPIRRDSEPKISLPPTGMHFPLHIKPEEGAEFVSDVSVLPIPWKGETGFVMSLRPGLSRASEIGGTSLSIKGSGDSADDANLRKLEACISGIEKWLSEENATVFREIRQFPMALDKADITVSKADNTHLLRQVLVEVMSLSLRYWIQTTGKTKVDLAEESRIWTASLNKYGTWNTRTLDRYLTTESLPQKPRWRNVLQTAYFTIQNCPETAAELKTEFQEKIRQLENLLGGYGQ
ncbi:MAG: response regulator [Proteobacteria bacterium]|nr:response regulator [Pseudomonadota bacterium]